ncbi:MAG: glycosyl transferase [Oscillochloris sp.]|nr:glycosyl transferase [Oscillochloris sp.]
MPRIAAQLLALLLLATVGVALSGAGVAYSAYRQTAASLTPRLAALDSRELFQTSRIFDRNGELLYEFFDAGRRTNVAIEDVSPLLIQATVAIEDASFFTNTGIDLSGIARTLITSLQAGEETGGASTITQQVIKNSVLTVEERAPDRRYERKIKEIILAQELDQVYRKEEILELYLNENFYGNLAYGIQAASESYFGISAADLSLSQAALLAGLPQLPTLYNPINYLERDEEGGYLPGVRLEDGWLDPAYALPNGTTPPRARQVAVLRQMVDEGYVSEAEARAAAEPDLRFAAQEVPLNAPHFVFYVRDQLLERYGNEILNGGGLRITTTLDLNLQRMAQQKAYERINELSERNIHNAAVVVMQPNTGQILAMVGSIDYNAVKPTDTPGETGNVLDGQVNVATRERQPGSALKPFTYLSAMEQGMTPETVLWDVPTEFPIAAGEWYAPLNYNTRFNGPVRIRTALANSLNMPAVKALKYAGIENTLDLLDRVGIKQGLKRGADFYGLSLTLGGGEVTPLELTTAYNTLASNGRYFPPVTILQITDGAGRELERFSPSEGEEVVDPGLAAIISDMMSDDQARQAVWGLNSPLQLSLPAAVKTGTTNDWRDAWAAGFTPFVTVGVWTGNNNNEATERVESLTGGGIIWRNVMEEIFNLIRAEPRYAELFAAPYADGVIPTGFVRPEEDPLRTRPICALPGSFGGYNEELFTPAMLTATISDTVNLPVGSELDARLDTVRIPCSAYDRATVVRVPQAEDWTSDGVLLIGANPTPANPEDESELTSNDLDSLSGASYCRPVEGVATPPELTREIYIWKLPPPDPDEKVEYRWSGGSAGGALKIDDLTACSPEMFEPPIPQPPVAGAILMPDLKRFGENQAKEILDSLGITPDRIYIDYQTRSRIPDVFDQFVPYSVVSTLPVAGDWILPGTTIVLGIRSPSETEVPQPAPPPGTEPSEPPPSNPPPGEPPPGEPGAPGDIPITPPQQPIPLPPEPLPGGTP